MRIRKRGLFMVVAVFFIAASFSLCQKGAQTGSTTKVVLSDQEAVEAGQEGEEGGVKEIPKPPKVYIGTWKPKGDKPSLFKDALKELEKKNYKTALEKFTKLIDEDPQNYWSAESRLHAARCHYQLSEFDEALDLLTKFIDSKPGLVWEARTMTTLSELYIALPYSGYERSDKVYYNYDDREGEYKYMDAENKAEAVSYREKTRLAYVALLGAPEAKRGAAPGDDLREEAVVNSFSLVQVLENNYWSFYDACPPAKPIDPPKQGSLYDPSWTEREKVLFLLDEVPDLNKGRSDTHPVAWSGFKKALFLVRYPECPPADWSKQQAKKQEAWSKKHKDEFDPPPFIGDIYEAPDDLNPLALIRKVVKDFPDDPDADLFFATVGRVHESRGEFDKALDVYDKFLKKFKKSKWEDDVRYSLHEIRRPTMSVSSDGVGYPKEDDTVSLWSRNVSKVTFDIYTIDLPALLLNPSYLNNPDKYFADTYSMFYDFNGAKAHLKSKVKSFTYTTHDQGDFRPVSGQVRLPTLPSGTYLVHARGEKVESISLLVRTDMIVVGKPLTDSMRYLVADSWTGKPLPGVELTIRELYYDYKAGYMRHVKVTKDKTDAEGRYTYQLLKGNDISGNMVEILVKSGKTMAMTNDQYPSYYYRGDTDETYKIFTTTDRPVYRPGDTIRFKHIVKSYKNGKNNPAPFVKVKMEVLNPKGEKILEKTEKATTFGTVWGEVKVDEEPPLGVYTARAYVEGQEYRSYQSSGSQFRVEEYKKPEFEVLVKPTKTLASAGDTVSALIEAKYYWGAPVADAEVSYKIYRSVYWHAYVPPNKWDWLYGSGFGVVWNLPYAGGEELVSDGEGVTDDMGTMEVKFPSPEKDMEYDYEYKVVAEVTDLSRRTINGAGSVKFTRDPFYVYVVSPYAFLTEGDKVDVEVLAMTADDEPVAAKGTVELVRLNYPVAEEIKEEVVQQSKLELDAKGRAYFKIKVDTAGQYTIRFKGKKGDSKEVAGETLINVAGKTFDKKWFRFQNVDLLSQSRTYKKGEEIKVLVATPWDDATVWLTHEGGDEVFFDGIEKPKGGSFVQTFKATESHQPNFFVTAIVVRENRVHVAEREIFVPPEEGILEATVKAGKDEYKPREKGAFTITVKDSAGKPVQGEFSVAVFDKSVLYIQEETAGDIRPYYYGDRRWKGIYTFHSAQIYLSAFTFDGETWPTFNTAGLPTSYGYFYELYRGGLQFECPSCEEGYMYFSGGGGYGGGYYGYGGGGGGLGNAMYDMAEAEAPMPMEKAAKQEAAPTPAVAASQPAGGLKVAESTTIATKGDRDYDGIPDMADKAPGAAGPETREFFPDTALWKPDVVTGADGKAKVDIEWPDSLTTWAVRIVGVDGTNKVAIAKTEVRTAKKLVARLETPRFMVEGDRAKLAAVIHNDYAEPLEVALEIAITGEGIEAVGGTSKKITVPAKKDARADFEVTAIHAEKVKIKLSATCSKDSDALVKTFEVMEWGSDKMVAQSDIMRKPGKMQLTFDVPAERKTDTAELTVVAEPTIGGSLLRALPYLIHYPYGCVEQTMSRFFPAVIVARTLKDGGVKLSSIPEMAKKASLADPLMAQQAEVQMAWWEQPIYDDAQLELIVKTGLKKLYGFQHADGGWAWWLWGDSDPYMTAYVLIGLWEAKEAGYNVDTAVIDRGMSYLAGQLKKLAKKQYSPRELRAYIGYALSLEKDKRIKFKDLEDVYAHREEMSHYGQALIGLAVWNLGEKAKGKEVIYSLVDVSWVDKKNKTASFKWKKDFWWDWYYDRVETVSWMLRALVTVDPDHEYNDYYAKWLMLNRQGNQWYSTKDTAIALYGLTLYMGHHKELSPSSTVKILVNGKERKTVVFTKDNALAGQGTVILRGKEIPDGKLKISIEMQGEGSVYANAFLTYFTKEAKIEGSGNEIYVERTYWLLKEKKKKVKTWHGEITKLDYERIPLKEGDEIKSGALIEVKIKVEAKNDYEYLVFEDFKPAGCEPTALKSGGVFEHGTWINRELRDEKVVNFLYLLPQGKQAITYQLRAEIPGTFKVLPHKGYAMYAPRVRAISDSATLVISE